MVKRKMTIIRTKRSTKNTHKTKDQVIRTPLKTWNKLMCSGGVSSGTRCVNFSCSISIPTNMFCIVGHIYAIGNCGQANEHGICPECKSRIGGMGHLQTDNTSAHEMTGR